MAGGSICVILSSSVREPIPALTTSNLLRPGLVGLIKSLVPEIAPVRINGIAPGRVATGRIATLDEGRARAAGISVEQVQQQTIARIPLGRYGDPAEVGRVARSCFRRPRRTSPARSSRSMEGWSAPCRGAP